MSDLVAILLKALHAND